MRTIILPFLISLFSFLLFGSCNESPAPTIILEELKGNYTGTFQRFVGEEAGEVAIIEVFFDEDTWGGSSSISKYPALCAGNYTIENNQITFTNGCFWTAEFDWSLILSGTYTIKQTEDKITFEKIMDRGEEKIRDVYVLPISK